MPRYRRSFPAQRIVNQLSGNTGVVTRPIRKNLTTEGRVLQAQIRRSNALPVDTGRLQRSVKVKFVGGKDPRFTTETVEHGLFQNEGTRKGVPARRFLEESLSGTGRQVWEASARKRAKR